MIAEDFDGEIIDSDEGNLEWVDDGKIYDLNICERDKFLFDWMNQEKFFSTKMIYVDGKLESYQVVFY